VMVASMAVGRTAVVVSRRVDVHVLGARRERAEVIGEILERARVVRAEERDDVLEARRCAVPFFFGRAFAARAVEEHAEAARRVGLLCLFFCSLSEKRGGKGVE
jgi:hypothetical protein